jgi:hypothetical protein
MSFRDFFNTVKNVPEVRLRDLWKLAKEYKEAFPEVWRDVMRGERSPDIKRALKSKALLAERALASRELTFDDEIERIATETNLIEASQAKDANTKLKRAWKFLDKLGQVSERTGKVAGYKFLRKYSDRPESEIAHVVRTRVGTPDVKRRGALQQLTNNLFMFSNVNKEGIRSAYESYREDPGGYIWKTIATNVVPKLLVASAAAGYLGEEIQGAFDNIPNYDKKMYTTIPLWVSDKGTTYLRIPNDYEGQLFGAAAWDILSGKFTGDDSLIQTGANVSPYQKHPLWETSEDLIDYYINNINPIDEWRGRNVIPRAAFEVGGVEAHKAMAKHAWKGMGGGVIFDPDQGMKLMRLPGLNVLGTFLKTSNRGMSEKLDRILEDSEIRQGMAKDALERRLVINHGVKRGKELFDITNELKDRNLMTPRSKGAVRRQIQKTRAFQSDNPYVRALAGTKNKDEVELLLDEYRKIMPEEEVQRIQQEWSEGK